jgi:hypothetical protein
MEATNASYFQSIKKNVIISYKDMEGDYKWDR